MQGFILTATEKCTLVVDSTLRLSGYNNPRKRFFSINKQIFMVFLTI